MIASYPTRNFQIWEYTASHGSLLIRSPRKPSIATNIDIIFVGVEFMSIPRHLKGVELMHGSSDDVERAESATGRKIDVERVFVLVSERNRFLVVAAAYKLDENTADIFYSPFA